MHYIARLKFKNTIFGFFVWSCNGVLACEKNIVIKRNVSFIDYVNKNIIMVSVIVIQLNYVFLAQKAIFSDVLTFRHLYWAKLSYVLMFKNKIVFLKHPTTVPVRPAIVNVFFCC